MRTHTKACLVIVLALFSSSCSGETRAPVLESVPPETVPSDWITYTDETVSIRLSYPSDWESLEFDPAAFDEMLDSLEAGTERGEALTFFSAGLPGGPVGFEPNVQVSVQTLPFEMTADEFAEVAVQAVAELLTTWETSSLTKLRFGDRDAVLVVGSVRLLETNPEVTDETRFWLVDGFMTDGTNGWAVTCGLSDLIPTGVDLGLETCESVVRTFELLTP